MKATYKDKTIAESDTTIEIEGNQYFPPEDVKTGMLEESPTPYTCPWKGVCQYYNVVVNDETLMDAAWSYPEPKEAAKQIAKYVAFGKPVAISE